MKPHRRSRSFESPEPVLGTITDLRPLKNSGLFAVRVGPRVAARLTSEQIRDLGIAIGDDWTAEHAAQAATGNQLEKCRTKALAMLNRRALSRSELADKLKQRGFDSLQIESVLDRLDRHRLIDDAALGRVLIRQHMARRSGPALIRQKLRHRGIPSALAEELLAENNSTRDLLEDALQAARKRLRSATLQKADPAVRNRRLHGFLSRRGFDPSTVHQAMARIRLDTAGVRPEDF